MQTTDIKKAAYEAAKGSDINLDEYNKDYCFTDELYFLAMLFFYKSYAMGAINKASGEVMEQRICAKYKKLSTAYYFSKKHFDSMVAGFHNLGQLKTKLAMQLKNGDKEVLHTLFELLDYYTNDNIYEKLFLATKSGYLNDISLDEIISACPEEYRQSMTIDECRTAVWNFIKSVNGEVEV